MNDSGKHQTATVARRLADWLVDLEDRPVPDAVARTCRDLLLDYAGLCVAARGTDYVHAVLAASQEPGSATVIGHDRRTDPYAAALVNGTAAHGEDFDDTFEGGPIHSSAVVMPAVLAACERFGGSGADALRGVAAGVELMCRLSLVAPKAIHKAGFHPTAVIGALAAAAGVGSALRLDRDQLVSALGIAGSMASGIIEYLSDGSWTKRMHAGWAAQSGIRAALLAQQGFVGPARVLEGDHGFFHGFAPSRDPDFDALLDGLGERWLITTIAFKPYACGTMTQPYVDCAIELAGRGVAPDEIASILCEVGEGTVHRLWEPLAAKRRPPTPYFGKFSTPYCIAVGFFDRAAGLAQFTDEKVADPRIRALAEKVSYVIDPDNPYPKRFTGHLRATLRDGSVVEIRRENMRGGAHAPLAPGELERKFTDNVIYGGLSPERAERMKRAIDGLFGASDMSGLGALGGAA
jgi:2-methylcitrate dehydratase PrpD